MKRLTQSLTVFLLTIASLLIAAYSNSSNKSNQLPSGVITQNMDTTIKPGDNFHAYVNGRWIKKTPIPADRPVYGASDEVRDKVQAEVKIIIEESASSNSVPGTEGQKIGDFYKSFIDIKERESLGMTPLSADLQKITAISSLKDLAAYFGYANKSTKLTPYRSYTLNKIPFNMNVWVDFKQPSQYMLFSWQAGLGLPEREYYFLEDAKTKDIRKKYVAHMDNMLQAAGVENSKEKVEKIMALETLLASKHMKKEETRDFSRLFDKKYSTEQLSRMMPDFDWNTFFKAAGIPKLDSIAIPQVEYTKALNDIIKNTPLDTWKSYLQWSLIHGAANYLTSALDQEHFEFYDKTLLGLQSQLPSWRRGVDLVSTNLGQIVGKVYVKKHFSPQAKERMLTLVDNLLKAYQSSIQELHWMSAETKKEALDKLSKFMPKIGYPDKWKDYSGLEIASQDLYGNMRRAYEFEYNYNINKLGKPVDRIEWVGIATPQTVNAFYNPSLNEIIFPAAILQPPAFNMTAEDAINYGGIGAIIGHEIGHGFDDQGSTFDGDGMMRNWWSEKDKQEFKKRTSALVSQYNEFKVFDDLPVNGTFTLGENIGDLGGVNIALKAYKASLKGKSAPVLDGFTGEQRVFIGWAQCWLKKEREAYLRNQVGTDPHAPAKFRVNGVVRNIPEFYAAFDVKPTDSLYLAPEKRVEIW
jgi:putative endopeptidase